MRPSPDEIREAREDGEIGFRQAVYAMVDCIPCGRVAGYGHVATWLGQPRAARQVGFALAALEPGTSGPWWRVIRSNGTIALQGDPARGPRQLSQLRIEGVEATDWKVSMRLHAWRPE
jgi:methylated-DNA-protein-cysteine methyltransferase-like protein